MMKRWLVAILCLFPLASAAQEIEVQNVPYGAAGRGAWLVESRDVPVISAKFSFREAGAASDGQQQAGRAQMVAALLSQGAGDMDALAFQQALESHAIRLSFSADGDRLYAELQTLAEHADKAFDLLGLALARPRFDDEAVARVKAQMLASLRQMEEQPRYAAARALAVRVFGAHPYASPVEGTAAGIAVVARPDLQAYLGAYVTAGNLEISVVGDITAPQLKTLLDKHLSALPGQFRPARPVAEWAWQAQPGVELLPREVPQTTVFFAGEGIPREDKDFYAAFVLNHLLGGGTLTSRLGDEIREKRGLAYYAYTSLQIMDHAALFTGAFGTRNDQAAEALGIARQTLREVAEGGITQAQLDAAKGYIIGAWPLTLSSNGSIADMLEVMQRFHLGRDYLKERNGLIAAVTLEDVKRVAKRLVRDDRLVVVGAGAPSPALDGSDNKKNMNREGE